MKMVCIKRGPWRCRHTKMVTNGGPSYGELVTVESIIISENKAFYYLEGYTQTTAKGNRLRYGAAHFRPVIHDRLVGDKADFLKTMSDYHKTKTRRTKNA